MAIKALVHASEILTGIGIRAKDGRHPREEDLGRIEDGAIVYKTKKVRAIGPNGRARSVEVADRILWVGPTGDLPKKYSRVSKKNLRRRQAIIPGLIDCHNHLVFAGDRADEFALRCGGATYEEIAARGGGILTTVRATREASIEELERLAIPRVEEARSYGIRTLEVKSGYGLSVEAELKVLEVVPRLRKRFPEMTFTATFLGAHAYPKDQPREAYFKDLVERMLPEVARRGLADSCDVFVDEGYYTVDEARTILTRARKLGLKIKIHADELGNTESAALAAELKALSADHLLRISDNGISKLAASKTVAVLLPGTAFYLKAPYAPARKLIEAGARVALSTDFNPGTSVTLSLPTIMTLSALYLGMSRAEIFAATTFNAAAALGIEESKGTLEVGKDADFTVLPYARFEELYYRFSASGSCRVLA